MKKHLENQFCIVWFPPWCGDKHFVLNIISHYCFQFIFCFMIKWFTLIIQCVKNKELRYLLSLLCPPMLWNVFAGGMLPSLSQPSPPPKMFNQTSSDPLLLPTPKTALEVANFAFAYLGYILPWAYALPPQSIFRRVSRKIISRFIMASTSTNGNGNNSETDIYNRSAFILQLTREQIKEKAFFKTFSI